MDIFQYTWEEQVKKDSPLARRMSPRSLEEFVGQKHLLGESKPLRRAIEGDLLPSMFFYGPPGTGKTALARIIASVTRSRFNRLNAVTAGVKDVRSVIENAKQDRSVTGRKTILFMDEIHRFNKAQQDALLPAVEDGLLYLIGATTENPYFSIISPLLSRSMLFRFESLEAEELKKIIKRALEDKERGFGKYSLRIQEDALEYLVQMAGGDARIAINTLEMAVLNSAFLENNDKINIDLQILQDLLMRKSLKYDRTGDYHYDIISAFIKSIRGSDPDAALYWLTRMLEAGEDPLFIARRLVISASEDIGNADPSALTLALSVLQAVQVIGLPEGRILLAQAVTYLAAAPKSNASYMALNKALETQKNTPDKRVPSHLRDTSYKGADLMGHGRGYLYPHDYTGHFVPQSYLPEGMEKTVFYEPGEQGTEKEITKRLRKWRALMGKGWE